MHTIPLRQYHRDDLAVSKYEEFDPSTASPALATTSPVKGDSNSLWMYHEELINLYWARDLPLREVRQIMKHEHGLDVSIKVYKSQFRRWGIRKNLKRHEALELGTGQKSSSIFWPDVKDEEYASRIERHLRNNNRRSDFALSHAQSCTAIGTRAPPRRIRAPDALEKVEAGIYYLNIYINKNQGTEKWFKTGHVIEEQTTFANLLTNGLESLSRNDRPRQAFQDINRAFDQLKPIVTRDNPLVCVNLMVAASAFAQYPESQICFQVCRLLADLVRKLTRIIHGPNHPLNHIWSDTLHLASGADPGSLVFGVGVTGVERCEANRPRHASSALDIANHVQSHATGLDEDYLRESLATMAASPDLLSKAQDTRLALSELLLREGRIQEAVHFYYEAIAAMEEDTVQHARRFRGGEGLNFQVSIYGKPISHFFVEFPTLND